MSKRYDVVSRRPGKDDKAYFHRIGTAFEGEKGISLKLDSLPLPNDKGEVWLSLYEPRDRSGLPASQPDRQDTGGRFADTVDDEISF